MSSIQQATTGLEETRRSVLYNLIKARYADQEDVGDDFIKQEMETYLESLDRGAPILSARPQERLTNADAINEEMQEAMIDIYTIFQQLDHVGQQVDQHQKLNDSVLADIKLKVKKSDENLVAYNQLLVDLAAHAVVYETFLDYNSVEKEASLFTERDGSEVAPSYHAKMDVYQNALKLPETFKENTLVNFSGLKIADIHITKQLGGGFIRTKNPEQDVSQAIDSAAETFWNESILTDAPLEVNLGLEYYGIDFGAVCELEIRFDTMTSLNEITLTPFCEYPVEVVAILGYETDMEDEEGFEIVRPGGRLGSKESTDVISYQFQNATAKRLRIMLNQKHYVKRDMIVDVEEKSLTDAWLNAQGFNVVKDDNLFPAIYDDEFEQNPSWFYLKEFLRKRNVVGEIGKFKTGVESRRLQVSKYEYQYGLYNLGINRNEYAKTGVYVSRPMTNQNVHVATLTAEEEHTPLTGTDVIVTNVEYYVTDKEVPVAKDWYPIMPANIPSIESELLNFTYNGNESIARIRFNPKAVNRVRRNGNPLRPTQDYQVVGKRILMKNHDLSSVYTIDYEPSDDAYSVDFLKVYTDRNGKIQLNNSLESFTGLSKGNQVKLAHHPFLDKERMNKQALDWNPALLSSPYVPIKVSLILPDGQHINPPADKYDTDNIILNKTDYFNPKVSLLEPFTGENYQYRVIDNKVKFNVDLPKETRIIIEYGYLTGPVRMKAILRRNLHGAEGLTPFVHEYKMVFQSLT